MLHFFFCDTLCYKHSCTFSEFSKEFLAEKASKIIIASALKGCDDFLLQLQCSEGKKSIIPRYSSTSHFFYV